jgi:hypothetical protein
MPSVSKKQHNFMAAIAKNPGFAKKVGIPRSVGEEFLTADKGKKFREGGTMKKANPFMEMIAKKKAGEAVKGHEKKMHKMAKGGVTRADGCITKGHTKGKMITMKSGGMC